MDYKGLKDLIRKVLAEQQAKESTSNNKLNKHISAINIWVKTLGLSDDSKVVEQFSPGAFNEALELFSNRLLETGARPSSIGPLKSLVRFAQREHLANATSKQWLLADDFPMALRALMKEHGYKNSIDLGKATGINSSTIRCWLRGTTKIQRRKLLQSLERVFTNLRPGELAAVLPAGIANGRSDEDRIKWKKENLAKSEYRSRRIALTMVPYGADLNALPTVAHELQSLYKFKTDPVNLTTFYRQDLWNVVSDEGCATYEKLRKELSMFFGFLINPASSDPMISGLGLDPATVSLANLSEPEILRQFLDFLSLRSGLKDEKNGEYNRYPPFAKMFIRTAKSLINPDRGYVYQNYELFGAKLKKEMIPSEWQTHCANAFRLYSNFVKDLKFHAGRKEDSSINDVIYPILEQQYPIQEVIAVKVALKEEARKVTTDPVRCARVWRDLALISLVSIFPLRSRTLRNLRIGSNIFKRDGRYFLKLKASELKNWYSSAVKDIEVCLDDPDDESTENSDIFEEYLSNQRPKIEGSSGPYVFVPVFTKKKGRTKFTGISETLAKITETYGPSRLPIHAHRMRDVVATNFVRNFPDGVRRAARALFDTEEVVIKNYAHVSKRDRSQGVYDGIKEASNQNPTVKSRKGRGLTDLLLDDPVDEIFRELEKRFGREQLLAMKRDTFEAVTHAAKPYIRAGLWDVIQKARK